MKPDFESFLRYGHGDRYAHGDFTSAWCARMAEAMVDAAQNLLRSSTPFNEVIARMRSSFDYTLIAAWPELVNHHRRQWEEELIALHDRLVKKPAPPPSATWAWRCWYCGLYNGIAGKRTCAECGAPTVQPVRSEVQHAR